VATVGKKFFVLSIISFLFLNPSQAANGPAVTVVGTKGPVTLPSDGDAQAAYRMPSSIGWATSSRLDFNFFLGITASTLENTQNDFEDTSTSPGASFGVFFAFGRPSIDASEEAWSSYSFSNKWTLHIGEFVELAGGGGEAEVRSTTFPETKGVGTGITFLTTAFTLAYTPTEWLSFGFGFHFIYASLDIKALSGGNDTSLDGSPLIAGVPLPGNPTYADFLNLFSSGGDTDPSTFLETDLTAFQFTGIFSVSIKPHEIFSFGASYSPRSYAQDFEGEATIDATRTFQGALGGLSAPIQSLFLGTLPNGGNNGFVSDYDITVRKLKVPRKIRASVAIWPVPSWMIAFEVSWVEWHRAFRNVNVSLTNGNNQDLNFVTGSNSITTVLKQRFHNRFGFSLQSAFAVTDDVTVRLGANYSKSPLNIDRQGNSPSAGFLELAFTAGFGYKITQNLEFSFLSEIGVPAEEESDGSDTSLTGKFSRYSSQQYFLHFGLGYNF
jgi:long-subunit fatty acid transport protein